MKLLSKPFYIAGVKYSEAHKLTPKNNVDVSISHHPENKFDAFALACTIDGIPVGHIPRTEQATWFYHTFHNIPVRCRVVAWDRNKPPFEEIQVVLECSDTYMTTIVKQGAIPV